MLKISSKLPHLDSTQHRNIFEVITELFWENTIPVKYSVMLNTQNSVYEVMYYLINHMHGTPVELEKSQMTKLVFPDNGFDLHWFAVIYYDNNGNAYNVEMR